MTWRDSFMPTVQVGAVPLQAPPQARNAWPAAAVAVSVTSERLGICVLQALPPLPHWMVPEELDTAPLPLTLTDRVCVIGSGAALSSLPPPQAASDASSVRQAAVRPGRRPDGESG
jgi:hypothetical protein